MKMQISHCKNIISSVVSLSARPFLSQSRSLKIGQQINMSTNTDKRDHLTVTSSQSRDEDIHHVEITQICKLSSTVNELILQTKIRPVPFSFNAGQWVDMFIPGVKQVGGFSITSSPHVLKTTGNFHLAVKKSESPPSHWVHTECKVGSKVSIRVGGDFFLDVQKAKENKSPLLFIAGGVGINPLSSMIHELVDVNAMSPEGCRTFLLFSAKTEEELIYKDKFDAASTASGGFYTRYFVTGNKKSNDDARIQKSDIEDALNAVSKSQNHDSVQAFICGPPSMIDAMKQKLREFNVRNIFYENWWQ